MYHNLGYVCLRHVGRAKYLKHSCHAKEKRNIHSYVPALGRLGEVEFSEYKVILGCTENVRAEKTADRDTP